MKLCYPRKKNGMYVLSRDEIDSIAVDVLKEFQPEVLTSARPVDIEGLVEDGLSLSLKYEPLGKDNPVLGITVFEDMDIEGIYYTVPTGTILINNSANSIKRATRTRFTVAHECGHWVLHRSYHSPVNKQYKLRTMPYNACRETTIGRSNFTARTDDDWEEWQADAFASALLMPLPTFADYACRERKKGSIYVGVTEPYSYDGLCERVAKKFNVSLIAAEIRLKRFRIIY